MKITRLLREKLNINPEIERAHRVGKNKTKTRDIVVKFSRFQDRDAIYMGRRNLRGTNIYINEDLCPATMEVRHQQKDALREARQQGKIAYFNYRTLVIKERRANVGVIRQAGADTRPLGVPPFSPSRPPPPLHQASQEILPSALPTTSNVSPTTATTASSNNARPDDNSRPQDGLDSADHVTHTSTSGSTSDDRPSNPTGRGARLRSQPSYYQA